MPESDSVPQNVQSFRKLTRGRGFHYREMAAAGNVCVEMELGASFNTVFDSESLGILAVASPKHAEALLFSGPVSANMQSPLKRAWDTMPAPKALIAAGTEAISGGVHIQGKLPAEPDLFIGGDPPRPDVMLQAFRYLMGAYAFDFQKSLKAHIGSMLAGMKPEKPASSGKKSRSLKIAKG